MSDDFLISIVVPVYNVEKYIKRALRSLQSQTCRNFEVVVVDDCGQDKSIRIAEEYARNDSRFNVVYHEKNLGTYHARKTGVDFAAGDFILFFDPDDELKSETIEKLYSCDLKNKGIVFFDVTYEPAKSYFQYKVPALPVSKSERLIGALYRKTFFGYRFTSAAAAGKLIKKTNLVKAYEKLNISTSYRYVYAEDRLLFYATVINNDCYDVVNFDGYIYHKNSTSITNYGNICNGAFLIGQLEFTTGKLKTIVAEADLTEKDELFFSFFLNETSNHQIALMRRYENDGNKYLLHVWSAFKAVPRFKELVRMGVYLISFKKIKL